MLKMGNRAGYRVREGNKTSHILRKQWAIEDIGHVVKDVAQMLCTTVRGHGVVGAGNVALRNDLHIGRLAAAMYSVLYRAPFDSIATGINCDITDAGLYEIELVEWNVWEVWRYPVHLGATSPDTLGTARLITIVTFTGGKSVEEGMVYTLAGDV